MTVTIDGNGDITGYAPLVNVVRLSGSGTYTPSSSLVNSIVVELIGAGGGGGGSTATGASQLSLGSGGGAGGIVLHRYTSGFSGLSYSTGAPGTGANGVAGNPGGNTTFGALTAQGGSGGGQIPATANASIVNGGTGGTGSGGNIINGVGEAGGIATQFASAAAGLSGRGGNSRFGGAGLGLIGNFGGNSATGFGSGGGGGSTLASSPVEPGGNGSAGTIIVYEYN